MGGNASKIDVDIPAFMSKNPVLSGLSDEEVEDAVAVFKRVKTDEFEELLLALGAYKMKKRAVRLSRNGIVE